MCNMWGAKAANRVEQGEREQVHRGATRPAAAASATEAERLKRMATPMKWNGGATPLETEIAVGGLEGQVQRGVSQKGTRQRQRGAPQG